jgi:SAM-dependent methyltransferase
VDRHTFEAVAEVERNHWFFTARRRIIRTLLQRALGPESDQCILDVGTGTGATVELLQPFGRVVGVDFTLDAIPFCRRLGASAGPFVQGTVTSLPFARCSFDLVTAFDVLEHVADDRSAVLEVTRVLRQSGAFVSLVPAHPWLWSDFDEFSHHHRRYSAVALRQLLTRAGLSVERLFFVNAVLFAPIVAVRLLRTAWTRLVRKLGRSTTDRTPGTGLGMPPQLVNRVLTAAFGVEALLAPHVDIPFGVTLVAIARKR